MAGTKEQLKERELRYLAKIKEVPKKYVPFWERQLHAVRQQLYGHN